MADWQKSCQKTHTHTHHIGAGFGHFCPLKLFPLETAMGFGVFFVACFVATKIGTAGFSSKTE